MSLSIVCPSNGHCFFAKHIKQKNNEVVILFGVGDSTDLIWDLLAPWTESFLCKSTAKEAYLFSVTPTARKSFYEEEKDLFRRGTLSPIYKSHKGNFYLGKILPTQLFFALPRFREYLSPNIAENLIRQITKSTITKI